ncbi:MAG TPA: RsmB/NOP family class I SAM-dependent RNA methyltransferase, partial [Yoonia sp.]|nr:RsmB/NOP family class I SAM-dependent RNA methyltransferase [Yoonia sp.]
AGKFDVVFCDAPCTGSGTWRRAPDAKWRLTPADLAAVMQSQDEVLAASAPLVAEAGLLVYATCSILADENSRRVKNFCDTYPEWHIMDAHQDLPDANADGFYTCTLRRD